MYYVLTLVDKAMCYNLAVNPNSFTVKHVQHQKNFKGYKIMNFDKLYYILNIYK